MHMLPIFQKKIAYGSKGFPWSSDVSHREVTYNKGICPVAERLHDENFIGFHTCINELSNEDIDLVVIAFRKVWNRIDSLKF